MPQGVTINDAEQLQQLTGDVNFPCQSPDGTGAERATAEQLRQYTADNTAVSDLQGASNYATQTDLQGKQDALTAGANITIDADNEISATVPTKTSQLQNDSGFLTTETDPVFSDSPAAGITSQDITDWNNKSDFSGDYDDLTNKPTIPAAQVQADWTEGDSSAVDYIKNKPSLASVATSGNYNDLNNKPTIPAAQVNSDWNATSGVEQILNKPTLGTAAAADTTDFATAAQGSKADTAVQPADLATVATSGDYNDLLNKPTIGTPEYTIPNTTTTQELASNTVYLFESRTNNLTLTLGTPIAGQNNEYHFFVFVGATAPSITYPSGISWNGGSAPTITANKNYEISINNNIAAFFEI